GFRTVNDDTRLEELTVHSYDIRLKEKRYVCSMKDIVLVDLQENGLYSMEEYLQAINVVTEAFFSALYHYVFGDNKPFVQNPKLWHTNLFLEISHSAWQEISAIVEAKFGSLCKNAEYF
ncbi:14422_t:CDS:2, partial [Gigaspora rosea]